MASLNITVDDAQVARVRAAYGVATNGELRTAIISDIKAKVVSYEINQAHSNGQAAIASAQSDAITAGVTAKSNAELISIT